MSEPVFSRPPAPPQQRSGCLQALTIVIGVLLLLPGLCALFITGIDPKFLLHDPTALALIVVCLTIGAGGVALIWAAVRRPQ